MQDDRPQPQSTERPEWRKGWTPKLFQAEFIIRCKQADPIAWALPLADEYSDRRRRSIKRVLLKWRVEEAERAGR